jgi:predicted TIM-barrel fold metal-dependent hydrolase
MKPFVFSADGHLREPKDLFSEGLPPALREKGPHTRKDGDYILLMAGEKVIHRVRMNRPELAKTDARADFGRPNVMGASDLTARMADMEMEGIDAEIIFPTTAMFTFLLQDREAEVASCQVYNDWNDKWLSSNLDKFVRCAVLPVIDFNDTVAEMERIAKKGFTAAMLPSQMPVGIPLYNDPAWDKVFDAAERLGIVFTLHTATGREDVRPERGPGGAIVNYTDQMRDAIHSVMYLVAGGILDRFPKAKVAVIESGASWLAGLAERLDEVNETHAAFVKPVLSLKPSEIIARQVSASFQYDRACIMSRSVTGVQSMMWGSDYPHSEGTFPNSRKVLAELFDGIDISESDKAAIIGLNGARLFRLQHPALTAQAAA